MESYSHVKIIGRTDKGQKQTRDFKTGSVSQLKEMNRNCAHVIKKGQILTITRLSGLSSALKWILCTVSSG